MGQAAAPSAASWNAAGSAFGLVMIVCRWLDVTVQAPLNPVYQEDGL